MNDSPRGLARQATATQPETTKHHTFWRRFGAMAVDLVIVLPFISLGEYVSRSDRSMPVVVLGLFLSNLLPLVYRTFMHARFGQTVGKKIAGVKIVHASKDGPPSVFQCLLRDGPDYAFSLLTTGHVLMLFRQGLYQPEVFDSSPFARTLSLAYVTWFFCDSMVLAANFRRHALHDWLAGTVVVKCPPKRRKPAVNV